MEACVVYCTYVRVHMLSSHNVCAHKTLHSFWVNLRASVNMRVKKTAYETKIRGLYASSTCDNVACVCILIRLPSFFLLHLILYHFIH